jgi:sphingosine-1-phosphate phosphatase 1
MAGTLLATLAFMTVAFSPRWHLPVRHALRPWAMRHVAHQKKWVVWFERFQHPILDRWHNLLSYTCGLEFYITVLPILYWVGEVQLARQLTVFMGLVIYVGNAIKDIVCSPRPDVSRRIDFEGTREYGLPSTHTVNTIAMAGYILHYYHTHGGSENTGVLSDEKVMWLSFGLAFWCANVMFGRIYLGMHSPIDIYCGAIVGLTCLCFWCCVDDYIDAWITRGPFVPGYQLILDIVLVFSYPHPLEPNPAYNYALYFMGVCLGIISGVWWTFEEFHSNAAHHATVAARGCSLFSGCGAIWTLKRFLVGLVVVLALRSVGKSVSKKVIPALAALFRIPCSDHDATDPSIAAAVATGQTGLLSDTDIVAEKKDKARSRSPAPSGGTTRKRAVEKKTNTKTKEAPGSSHVDDPKTIAAALVAAGGPMRTDWNTATGVRFATYTVVGWSVVCPVFYLFEYLGI